MFAFLKKLFGSKPAEVAPAPYKVEEPKKEVEKVAKPKAGKKPTVKKATTRKPKAPKA